VVSDGVDSYIPVILEHVERAGVHSGDSIAHIPPRTISAAAKSKIVQYTSALCRALPIKGIANIQYIVDGDTVYCLEVNPRASRTVPFVTKVTGFPIIRVATGLSLGRSLKSYGPYAGCGPEPPVCAVKMPVFSWSKMRVDPVVGPEMKSTGEVMGIGADLEEALQKSFLSLGVSRLGPGSGVLLTVADRDKPSCLETARGLSGAGWRLYATKGTARYLAEAGVEVQVVRKLSEPGDGSSNCPPGIPEVIADGRVQVVVNTFTKGGSEETDGFKIRSLAIGRGIPVLSCIETAYAMARAASAQARTGVDWEDRGVLAIQDIPVCAGEILSS